MKAKYLGLLMLALSIGSAPAWCANITITDLTDNISITAGNFEYGFTAGGIGFNQGLGVNDTHTYSEANGPISFSGTWITDGIGGSGSSVIYLVEPQDTTLVSDIFSYSWTDNGDSTGTITGTFTSDFENNLGHISDYTITTNDQVLVEDGTPVPFNLAFLSGTIQSDVSETPEPATFTYFGVGLGGLLLGVKKFRRA
jgi:hypothetical protein